MYYLDLDTYTFNTNIQSLSTVVFFVLLLTVLFELFEMF